MQAIWTSRTLREALDEVSSRWSAPPPIVRVVTMTSLSPAWSPAFRKAEAAQTPDQTRHIGAADNQLGADLGLGEAVGILGQDHQEVELGLADAVAPEEPVGLLLQTLGGPHHGDDHAVAFGPLFSPSIRRHVHSKHVNMLTKYRIPWAVSIR